MVSGCVRFYDVESGDNCADIASDAGIPLRHACHLCTLKMVAKEVLTFWQLVLRMEPSCWIVVCGLGGRGVRLYWYIGASHDDSEWRPSPCTDFDLGSR